MRPVFLACLLAFSAVFLSPRFAISDELDAGPDAVVSDEAPAPAKVSVPTPEKDPVGFFEKLLQAANWKQKGGVQWKALLVCVLIGLVSLVRAGAKKASDFWGEDRGGAIIALVIGVCTTVAASLQAGDGVVTASTVIGAFLNSGLLSGWYVLVKRIVWPSKTLKATA